MGIEIIENEYRFEDITKPIAQEYNALAKLLEGISAALPSGDVDAVTSYLADLHGVIQSADKELYELTSVHEGLVLELREEIETKNDEISEKDGEISSKDDEVTAKNDEIEQLKSEHETALAEKDEEIDDLSGQLREE